ncbi:UNVERIFIED_CONTAM: hypothetical protein NCL1_34965 [Trichonephila clavipes]
MFNETQVCLHDEIRKISNYLRSLNGGGLLAFEKEDFPIEQYELVSSGTVPQWCEFGSSGPASTEQLENLVVDDGRQHQRLKIDTCSAWR